MFKRKKIDDYWYEYYDETNKIKLKDYEMKKLSPSVRKAIKLDKELEEFLKKYSSGKKNDFYEKKLNEEWGKKGDYFKDKAEKIFTKMDNYEIVFTCSCTNYLHMIIRPFDYYKSFSLDRDYIKENPYNLTPYYMRLIEQVNFLEDYSLNKMFYKYFLNKSKLLELQEDVLKLMCNKELMELANNSKTYDQKMYYYEFLDGNESN